MGKEKKEIGKLLELLNEYSKNIGYFNEEDLQGQTKAWMLSKEFGFIKRLVENNKIDLDEIERYSFFGYTYYQNLLMLLSISDTPIEDLLLYLK